MSCLGGLTGLFFLFPNVGFSTCRLPDSTGNLIPQGTVCFEGRWLNDVIGTSDVLGRRVAGQTQGLAYAGYYLYNWLSFHGKAYLKYSQLLSGKPDRDWQKTSEQFFLQLGHPLDQKIYGSAGWLPLPFGVNRDLYRYQLRSRGDAFWGGPVKGLRVSLKIRDDLRLELGGGAGSEEQLSKLPSQMLAARLTKLTDLLSGTKFIASYQADSLSNTRRSGLASLIYNNNNFTSLEWVRITDDLGDNFSQLFRFVHEQDVEPWSWSLIYEDIRNDSYRLSLGMARQILEVWSLGSSLHYEKLRTDSDRNQGYLLLSMTYGVNETFIPGRRGLGSDQAQTF